jgi:hypothetical protein
MEVWGQPAVTARYSIVPADAFTDARLTPSDIRVLGVLGSHLNKLNEAWPSQGRIAEIARVDRKTANRALQKLVEFGYVKASPRHKGPMKSTLLYQVILDPEIRAEAASEQPELFPAADFGRPKKPATADGEKFPTSQKSSTTTVEEKFPIDGENCLNDEAPGCPIDEAPGCPNLNIPNRTSPIDSSVPIGTDEGDENGEEQIASPPTTVELKKSIIWGTGKLLLRGQGLSDKQAGAFVGKLLKRSNLDIVFRVVQRAASDPPIDPRGWLTAAVEAEARKAGIAKPGEKADTGVDWAAAVASWEKFGFWPDRKLGPRPCEPGYAGPVEPLQRAALRIPPSHPNAGGLRANIDRLQAA